MKYLFKNDTWTAHKHFVLLLICQPSVRRDSFWSPRLVCLLYTSHLPNSDVEIVCLNRISVETYSKVRIPLVIGANILGVFSAESEIKKRTLRNKPGLRFVCNFSESLVVYPPWFLEGWSILEVADFNWGCTSCITSASSQTGKWSFYDAPWGLVAL